MCLYKFIILNFKKIVSLDTISMNNIDIVEPLIKFQNLAISSQAPIRFSSHAFL